jgi:hypothetical protein
MVEDKFGTSAFVHLSRVKDCDEMARKGKVKKEHYAHGMRQDEISKGKDRLERE